MSIPPGCCSSISVISVLSEVRVFEWNVLSTIQISHIFPWEVGDGPLYWFVVESEIEYNCPSLTQGYTDIQTIAATSVEHLCIRLQEMGYNKRIKSVKRWTKPALFCDQINISMCNELEEVDFCVTECASFTNCGQSLVANNYNIYVEELNIPLNLEI